MPYMDEAGLAYYSGKLKPWIASQPVKTLPSSLYPWTLTEKAGAVTCWPVGGTELKPTVDFLFSETGPASGDKGPENPSTISGVSSVGVADRSKNIYDFPNLSAEPYNGVTITCDADGTITLNGTCNLSSSQSKELYYTYPVAIKTISQIKVIASIYHIGGAYNISGSDTDIPVLVQVIRQSLTTGSFGYNWMEDTGADQTSIHSWTVSNAALITCSLRFFGGAVYNNYKIKVQYEISSDSTVPSSYEPPARNAFAVIPLGSTYYGGSIDLATGVMTVTHVIRTVDGTNVKFVDNGETTNYYRLYFPIVYSQPAADRVLDTKCTFIETANFGFNTDSEHYYVGTDRAYVFLDKTLPFLSGSGTVVEKANAYATQMVQGGTPWSVTYKLATPYTVQLTPTQILSLTQADKYNPRLNTVYTDAQAVQVGYAKSPIREEFELQQAIVGQGGNI